VVIHVSQRRLRASWSAEPGTVKLALIGCCLAGVLSSCESAPEPQPAPDLSVTVVQQRIDEATRIVGVEATNNTSAAVHISAIRLSGAGLVGRSVPRDSVLQPGIPVAMRTSYGPPDCDDRTGRVVAHLDVDGRTVDYPVDDEGQDWISRLLDADCAGIELEQTAAVRLRGPYRRAVVNGEPRLHAQLVMTRRSPGDAVDVRSLDGSVLLDFRPAGPLVDLLADEQRAVTPVLLGSNGRCDAHALGGSTQTFLLAAFVRLGDAPQQRVVLIPPPAVRDRVLAVVGRACGTS
jgi:hypothetical protein